MVDFNHGDDLTGATNLRASFRILVRDVGIHEPRNELFRRRFRPWPGLLTPYPTEQLHQQLALSYQMPLHYYSISSSAGTNTAFLITIQSRP